MRRGLGLVLLLGLMTPALTAVLTAEPDTSPASAAGSAQRDPATDEIVTETDFRDAWADPTRTRIDLGADIVLRDCFLGDPIRETPYPMLLHGHGHTIRQSCFEKRVLRQDGTGFLDVRDVTLTRGGSDGPGAALTSRGEIVMSNCAVLQNLAEEPGGGVFSMRRVTVRRCHINGNLANDDGGGIYARRGGVQVYDSVLSTNLVDGSGGAIGSTGDILVVRSQVDGNTTDGDGGALYADEDGDVTVVESLIDGSDADGPGGAIFTLDGDVAVFDSTLIGNRADDRGGAISGEADVLLVNSTVARNLAVAHAGGGVWARGDLVAVNSTVTNNYAEGEGGGVLAAGQAILVSSTIVNNIASVGGNIGSSGTLSSFASIVGPPAFEGVTGDTIPTRRSCRVYDVASAGHNFVTDPSCELTKPTDITGDDPKLAQLEDDPNGFVLTPFDGSPVRGRIPSGDCRGQLPDPLPAGQLLEGFVDWDEVLARDAVGTVRDGGTPCDIGAVQSPTPGARGGRRTVVDPPGPPGQGATAPAPAAYEVVASGAPLQRVDDRRGNKSVRERLANLELRLERMNRDARRFDVMLGCMTRVRVQRTGDVRHRWGYVYNERDGTGLDMRPALARTEGQRGWDLLRTSTSPSCLSLPVDPNGTGEDARPLPRALTRKPHQDLWRWLHRLERLFDRVDTRTERFDDWSSCVGALSITEAGDAEQDLGYIVDEGPWPHRQARYPAIDVDDSEWDDPDYQVLAFRAGDQPFRPGPCGTDPGEGVDRTSPTAGAGRDGSARDLREDVAELAEDVADLGEPVEEITQWDECLFTVGMTERSGYVYRDRDGNRLHRSALSFDMRGDELADMSVLAFPGEEPPQIECNEDASGVETDE